MRWNPSIARGAVYAIAACEQDASHDLFDPEKGGPLQGATRAEDLLAFAAWLRTEKEKHSETEAFELKP